MKMRHCRLLLISIFIIAVLTTSSMAAIKTVTYNSELFTPDGDYVDWTGDHIFPKFDPAMGRLISVYFTATLNATLYGAAENKASGKVDKASIVVDTDMFVEMINGQKLPLYVRLNNSTTNISGFDGTWDFLGPSAFNGTDANDTWGYVYYDDPANVTYYSGIGTFPLLTYTHASSRVDGGGSWYSIIDTKAWSYATITYTYDDSRCLSGYKIDGCTGLPLSGWNITVSNSTHSWNALTNGSGFWQVCGLENNDTYTVCEVMRPGWAQISSPVCHNVTLAGLNITNLNFTNQKLYCISGKKINACTGNGLSNWDITVRNSSTGLVVGQNKTIIGGTWIVCGLVPGEYLVSETPKSGYKNITNLTQNVTLRCENETDINFLNIQLRTLGGRKIDDCTGHGLNGWTIIVYNATTNTTYTTTTSTISGTAGSWRITNLIPGYYQVSEVMQPGWINVTPTTLNVLLPCNGNKQDVDFHNRPLRCVSGYKLDACTKEGIPGWNITLNNSSGSWTKQTGSDGSYEFCNLAPGEYTITEDIRSGYMPTGEISIDIELNCTNLSNQNFTNQKLLCIGGRKYNDCTEDPMAGWNVEVFNATTQAFMGNDTTDDEGYWEVCDLLPGVYIARETLQPGWENHAPSQRVTLICENNTSIDFFNTPLMCIGGYKHDACNGVLPDWELILSNSSGEVDRAWTNDSGYYQFCNLSPGAYRICETLQDDWMALGNVTCKDVVLGCENRNDVNFNNTQLLCINGSKIDNCTGNGLGGWTIILQDSNGTEITRKDTEADGSYSFCSLEPGSYIVSEVPQSGWMSIGNTTINVELVCNDSEDNDFKNTPLHCISGYKIDDNTGLGLENWTIIIYNETGMEINRTTTDGSGYYQFCDLSPGVYRIYEEIKEGWTQLSPVGWLPPLAPVYPLPPATSGYHEVPLYCDNVTDKNFVNARLLCINGSKVNHCTDEPLAGWTINLHDETGAVINTTATDGNGRYSFCGLLSGNYTVCEVLQGNWKNITDICIPVELESENKENISFRNAPLGCLAGYKLNERDSGLEGWTIEVRNASGFVNSSVTNSSGFWQVCGLHPGTYEVSEILQGNYKNLSPSTVTVDLVDCPEGNLINFKNTLPAA